MARFLEAAHNSPKTEVMCLILGVGIAALGIYILLLMCVRWSLEVDDRPLRVIPGARRLMGVI